MTGQGLETITRRDGPNFDGLVVAAAGDPLAVGAKRHRLNPVGMAAQGLQTLTRRDLPDFHHVIIAPTNEHLAIGTKGDRPNAARVTGERL